MAWKYFKKVISINIEFHNFSDLASADVKTADTIEKLFRAPNRSIVVNREPHLIY